jgi:hypothetical protein
MRASAERRHIAGPVGRPTAGWIGAPHCGPMIGLRSRSVGSLLVLWLLAACDIQRAEPPVRRGVAAAPDSVAAAEVRAALRTYYARFTARDWPRFRDSFWPGATITTRWTPPGERAERVVVQSVDSFVARASEGPGALAVFSERMLRADILAYGALAQAWEDVGLAVAATGAWVVYRAEFGWRRDSVTSHHGIDAFHLMKHAGEWRIVSLTFQGELKDKPILRRQP